MKKKWGLRQLIFSSVVKGKPVDYVNIFTSVHSRMPPIFLKNAVKSTAANSSLAPLHCSPGICIFPSFRSLAATPRGNATVSWSEEKPNSLCGKHVASSAGCLFEVRLQIPELTHYVGVLVQIMFLHVNSLFGHIHIFYGLKIHISWLETRLKSLHSVLQHEKYVFKLWRITSLCNQNTTLHFPFVFFLYLTIDISVFMVGMLEMKCAVESWIVGLNDQNCRWDLHVIHFLPLCASHIFIMT